MFHLIQLSHGKLGIGVVKEGMHRKSVHTNLKQNARKAQKYAFNSKNIKKSKGHITSTVKFFCLWQKPQIKKVRSILIFIC